MTLSPGTKFGARFFLCVLLCSVGFWAFSVHERLGPLQRLIARSSVALERWAGGEALAYGHNIVVHTVNLDINHECTGIFVCVLFVSFVVAYPVSWRSRALGLGIGLPLLFVINVVRLATLARIIEIYPGAFFYFHEYVWQGFFMVFVLVGSIAWAERVE